MSFPVSSKSVVVFVCGVCVECVSCVLCCVVVCCVVLCGCWCWCAMCVCCAWVSVWCVARLGTREKTCTSKGLRVYCQNARTCSTCGRFAGAHGDVLNVHTEGFFPLSPLLSLHRHSLSVFLILSSFLLPVSLALALALALALPSKSTKQPLSSKFLPYSKKSTSGNKTSAGHFLPCSKIIHQEKKTVR